MALLGPTEMSAIWSLSGEKRTLNKLRSTSPIYEHTIYCRFPARTASRQSSRQRTLRGLADGGKQRLSDAGTNEDDVVYADLASAPSIISIVFLSPYTATNEPKRGPFSWPSNTW